MMICEVWSLKSEMETCSLFEEIITSSNDVYKDFESDMAVGIRMQGNPTQETAKGNNTTKQNASSYVLTRELQAKKSNLRDIACIFVKMYTTT
jgi:hypothetical protein